VNRPVSWWVRAVASLSANPFSEKLDDATANPRSINSSRTTVKLSCPVGTATGNAGSTMPCA